MIKKILLCLLLLQCTRAFAIEMTPDNLLNSLIHDFVQYALAEAEPIKNAAIRLFFLITCHTPFLLSYSSIVIESKACANAATMSFQ